MVLQHWAEAAGTADLASPLTARPGTVKSFPTTFDSLDDLWQLEKKLLEPPQESVSEEADARSQATANETLPRIEGDTFSLEEEPARGQAVNMVRSCLQSSLALKQALQDESIDPYEMKGILRNLGRCSDGGVRVFGLRRALAGVGRPWPKEKEGAFTCSRTFQQVAFGMFLGHP
ncbi:unnamed protein product [Durusdinium trenchii]|uniref:Uncharacterized protein n=1 Tax=Durusdinium trenchii TaxID=1381693 RepID=A0ABP0N5N2_9DINO